MPRSLPVLWLSLLSLAAADLAALPLWELEGSPNRIYLLGSIHFLRARDYPLPAAIDTALTEADVVVMELDLSAVDPLEMQDVMLRMASDPNGRTLDTLLGAAAYRRARGLAADIDIDLASMQAFEPWFAAMQVTQSRLMQLGFDGSQGVEMHLLLQATQLGKKIEGLETLESQLSALDSLPMPSQARFLMRTLEYAAELDGQMDDIVEAWKSGDTDTLQGDLMEEFGEEPTLYSKLIVQRNAHWTRQIEKMVGDGKNYLIVVGALHLVGKDSVQSMLSEKGYSTRKISD